VDRNPTTGIRAFREEALPARWKHIALQGAQWWLPKTKSCRERYITLSDEAKALLAAQLNLDTSRWVFPGLFDDKLPNSQRKTFRRVLAAIGAVSPPRHTQNACEPRVLCGFLKWKRPTEDKLSVEFWRCSSPLQETALPREQGHRGRGYIRCGRPGGLWLSPRISDLR